jgi:uncharacterized protein (DUF934 family)
MVLIRRRPSAPRSEATSASFEVLERDPFVTLGDGDVVPVGADVVVSLPRFERENDAILASATRVGVRLPSDRSVDAIVNDLTRVALVAIEFPKFQDGRGYSLAKLLRDRHHFAGELRAVGNVLRDQLAFMHRVGFDSFELDAKFGPGGRDPHAVLSAFDDFDVLYQASADVALPLWKRAQRA